MQPTPKAKKTILVVDDSATIRNIVRIYLMGKDLELIEAEDGARALQLTRLVPVDLIIADVVMPGMDGITMLKEIRASFQPKIKALPVILLTADRSAGLMERGTEAGASAFIKKPVAANDLLKAIEKLLPGSTTK